MMMKSFGVLLILATAASAQWIKQSVNTTSSFRGLSVVSEKVVWASGTGGTVIKTTDGGKTWTVMTVPGAEKLDFRDIEAFDEDTAFILSIGNGESSRIYKTTDGGTTWRLQFTNTDAKAFYDALACSDRNTCVAMSDPVDGRYRLIDTLNGGNEWRLVPNSGLPATNQGEASFAASGTCLIVEKEAKTRSYYIVSGGTAARVFRVSERKGVWTSSIAETPITKGSAGSGIFSIAMYDGKNGVIVGGNYEKPEERNSTFATTEDGGAHWRDGARPNGYRSGIAFIDRNTIVAVGTNGADISYSRAFTWEKLGTENLNAVAAKGRNAVWSVGPNGNVFRLDPRSLRNQSSPARLSKYEGQYHQASVSALILSHSTVASNCTASEENCAASTIVQVSAAGSRLEDAPHEYAFIVSGGKIFSDGFDATWSLTGAKPGKYTITVGIRIPFLDGAYWDFIGRTRTAEVVVR